MAGSSKARGVVPAGRLPDKLSLLRDHPLFREPPPVTLDRISTYLRRRSIPKGTVIFRKGDPGLGLVGVLAGAVKISIASADGRVIALNIIGEGEVFGEIALLDGRPRTADATAMSDCELMTIERREFIPFLQSQPNVTLKLMEILCSRLRNASKQAHEMAFLNLSTRLAKTLIRLAAKAEDSDRGGKVTITQREISQIVGRSRESTNKRLRAWQKKGWIRLQRGSVTVLKPEKLEDIVAASSDFDEND
jgi:CRP/FNR family transcriptional regulator, cyclic AMP receptor protein